MYYRLILTLLVLGAMLLLTAGNLIPSSPQEVADNLPAYTSEISSSWQASLGPWAGLALLFLGLALGWKQFANRVPAASTAAPKESTELKEQLERLRYLHELEVSRLQSDLEQKQQELTASTTHLMRLNQTIGDMKEQLAAINLQDRRGAEKQLHRISHEVATLSQPDEDWSHFEMLFNETHDDYIQRLKTRFGSLTIRDLRLCSYLRLNLTSKEIAPLMGISYRAIEAMRYRVRKKLGLSSDDNLTAFLLEF